MKKDLQPLPLSNLRPPTIGLLGSVNDRVLPQSSAQQSSAIPQLWGQSPTVTTPLETPSKYFANYADSQRPQLLSASMLIGAAGTTSATASGTVAANVTYDHAMLSPSLWIRTPVVSLPNPSGTPTFAAGSLLPQSPLSSMNERPGTDLQGAIRRKRRRGEDTGLNEVAQDAGTGHAAAVGLSLTSGSNVRSPPSTIRQLPPPSLPPPLPPPPVRGAGSSPGAVRQDLSALSPNVSASQMPSPDNEKRMIRTDPDTGLEASPNRRAVKEARQRVQVADVPTATAEAEYLPSPKVSRANLSQSASAVAARAAISATGGATNPGSSSNLAGLIAANENVETAASMLMQSSDSQRSLHAPNSVQQWPPLPKTPASASVYAAAGQTAAGGAAPSFSNSSSSAHAVGVPVLLYPDGTTVPLPITNGMLPYAAEPAGGVNVPMAMSGAAPALPPVAGVASAPAGAYNSSKGVLIPMLPPAQRAGDTAPKARSAVEVQRAIRNREAALKSRQNAKEKMSGLEQIHEDLKAQVKLLQDRNEELRRDLQMKPDEVRAETR